MFYTITNLQGSQTLISATGRLLQFYTITNLQGSQTLKRQRHGYICFTPLQTYKVLKPISIFIDLQLVLHHYKLTRFSNLK